MKILTLFLFLLVSWNNYAQENVRTIFSESPGCLFDLIDRNISSITKLIIKGPINGDDFVVMKNMISIAQLTDIDLRETTILGKEEGENNSIPSSAFENCTNLQSIILPDNLLAIGYNAFANCTGLSTIIFPPHMTTFGSGAFGRCTSLKKIVFPEDLLLIGENTFWACESLESVKFPNNKGLYNITIDRYAFLDCVNLREITFNYDYFIYEGAFQGCPLTSITCKSNLPPQIDHTTFNKETLEMCVLFIPENSYDNYVWQSPNWGKFNNIKTTGNSVHVQPLNRRPSYTLTDNLLTINSDKEISCLKIYDIKGNILHKSIKRSIHLESKGLFIVSVEYIDGSLSNFKVYNN